MGSFLDTLLNGALGVLRTASVAGGGSVLAIPGEIVLADTSASSPAVSAPQNPTTGAFFGVADINHNAATHAINLTGGGGGQFLEVPATPGTYSNTTTIVTSSQVCWWLFVQGLGWKLVYQFHG
jgi:hypothetical protein